MAGKYYNSHSIEQISFFINKFSKNPGPKLKKNPINPYGTHSKS